jgi:glucose-1-phosphate thymidylyltransferase
VYITDSFGKVYIDLMNATKGIVLAGGKGSRLWPMTTVCSKQLLPVYDKPAIYYPISTLMLTGIRQILIISSPEGIQTINRILGDGSRFGIELSYAEQPAPNGLPEAFIIGEKFIGQDPVIMILGDNFFHGHAITEMLRIEPHEHAKIFLYKVNDPSRYGVAELNEKGRVMSVVEKPTHSHSNLAITGFYYFDASVAERAKRLSSSGRGELEITDLISQYIAEELLSAAVFGRGYVWFDIGTPQALNDASNYVEVIQSRQGISIGSLEEVAWRMGFITDEMLRRIAASMPRCSYKSYLESII